MLPSQCDIDLNPNPAVALVLLQSYVTISVERLDCVFDDCDFFFFRLMFVCLFCFVSFFIFFGYFLISLIFHYYYYFVMDLFIYWSIEKFYPSCNTFANQDQSRSNIFFRAQIIEWNYKEYPEHLVEHCFGVQYYSDW